MLSFWEIIRSILSLEDEKEVENASLIISIQELQVVEPALPIPAPFTPPPRNNTMPFARVFSKKPVVLFENPYQVLQAAYRWKNPTVSC